MELTSLENKIKQYCIATLPLKDPKLGMEYHYNSIVFCLVDSIFSIGAKYGSVKGVVKRYCERFNLEEFDASCVHPSDNHTISAFIKNIEPYENDYGAAEIYNNSQRTSSQSGILKAEAVFEAAKVLQKHNIDRLDDIRILKNTEELERDFRSIRGQGSGISFSYFMMLCGDENRIKLDRWLLRFAEIAAGEPVSEEQVRNSLLHVCENLKNDYPGITPRRLDYLIWNYISITDTDSETEFRRNHSRIIEYYQFVEMRLKGICAALISETGKEWNEKLDEYESDPLGRLIYQLRSIQGNVNPAIFSEKEFDHLNSVREARNYWCHQCFSAPHHVTFKNGSLRENAFRTRLICDLSEAIEMDRKLAKIFACIGNQKDFSSTLF